VDAGPVSLAVGTVHVGGGGTLIDMILTGVLLCKKLHLFIHLFDGKQQFISLENMEMV
jgi:hypothetical protein